MSYDYVYDSNVIINLADTFIQANGTVHRKTSRN